MSRPACFSTVVSVGATYDANLGNIGWCVNSGTCANSSRNPGCPRGYEAAFENALADNVIVYSNSASFLDVAAPATCATSAAPGNTTTDCFGGTSSATPFTSGAAALAVQAAGKGVLTPADMRDVLTVSGDLVTDPKNGRVTPRINGLGVVTEAAAYGGGEPPANNPPTAAFTDNCSDLACTFSDTSTDGDGNVVSWSWDFGDGNGSAAQNPSHTYEAADTYTVTLTVTDDDGASGTVSQSVTVSAPDPGGINLVASSTSEGRTWTAIVTDTNGGALAGTFSNGGGSCSGDTCTSSGIRKNIGSVVFTEDTTGQTITVSKP
jgi:PKD repeat protein